MTERMIQVPESLIEDLLEHGLHRSNIEAFRALLSQSTPTAEQQVQYDDGEWSRTVEAATSPSIADMVPGTTFTEASGGWPRTLWTVGQRHDGTKFAKRQTDGWVLDPEDIDSSTIRDVTLP